MQCSGLGSAADWAMLKRLDPEVGVLGGQLRCLGHLQQAFGAATPYIQTVFNPLSQAKYLAGGLELLGYLRESPEMVLTALETITETTVRFVKAARRQGIAGIFLAVQHASYELLSEAEYERFGVPFDLRVLAAAEGLWLNVLHIHGNRVMFGLLSGYPVDVVNWHDRETAPNLRDGQRLVRGAVLGGLRQWDTLVRSGPDEVRREAADAVEQTGGRRFILGTGCVTPITAPWANLRAVRRMAGPIAR